MRKWDSVLGRGALVLGSIGLALGLAEGAFRLFGTHRLRPLLSGPFEGVVQVHSLTSLDPELGWIPKPDAKVDAAAWQGSVYILPDSTRSNGDPMEKDSACQVLAVGDSFTFGDEETNSATWPALLQQRTGCSVVNAGVNAYGVDQAVLRAKRFLKTKKFQTVVFGVIADDVVRTGLSVYRGLAKPYFTLKSGKLVLHSPSQKTQDIRLASVAGYDNPARAWIGWSHLADALLTKWAPELWLLQERRIVAHKDHEKVTCALLREFDQTLKESGVNGVLLFQYMPQLSALEERMLQKLARCLAGTGWAILDMLPELRKVREREPEKFSRLFRKIHMSRDGNEMTASFLAAQLGHHSNKSQ